MSDVAVQRDTVDEVIRAGRELIEVCRRPDPKIDPAEYMQKIVSLKVMLDEPEEAAADG